MAILNVYCRHIYIIQSSLCRKFKYQNIKCLKCLVMSFVILIVIVRLRLLSLCVSRVFGFISGRILMKLGTFIGSYAIE